VGKNAKIGSNAVVVKDVPEGATAVGIPARILEEEKAKQEAQKAKFSAYAVVSDDEDPMTKAIHTLLDHSAAQEKELQALKAQLASLLDTQADSQVAEAFAKKPKSKSAK
jgi:serine O-acetyltransferase